jgi:hypothetical protein
MMVVDAGEAGTALLCGEADHDVGGVRMSTRAHDLEQQVDGPAGRIQEPPARPVLGS